MDATNRAGELIDLPTDDKLIRDRIPAIIAAQGKRCEVAELADLVEVVAAIVAERGLSWAEFEALRAAKRAERGGFEQRLLLLSVDP